MTCDTLYDGELTVYQEKEGYRFSLDAILLAGLTNMKTGDRVIDLGTGSGIILLIFAHRKIGSSLVGVEIQSDLAALAGQSVEANGLEGRIRILEADYRQIESFCLPDSFDVVICNPPYRRLKTGRINPHRQRAVARHELTSCMADVFRAAGYLLVSGGRLAVIYPPSRLGDLLQVAGDSGFCPKNLTIIHSYADGPAQFVHLECRKGGRGGLNVGPPFVIYREKGIYTESMQALYMK